MLIKSRKIWLVIWIAVFVFILYGGVTDGWTPLRTVSCVMLGLSVLLNLAGLYFSQGLMRHMDRMTDEQRSAFLLQFKESERKRLLRRFEDHRGSRSKPVD
jgi:hypothetical protein